MKLTARDYPFVTDVDANDMRPGFRFSTNGPDHEVVGVFWRSNDKGCAYSQRIGTDGPGGDLYIMVLYGTGYVSSPRWELPERELGKAVGWHKRPAA